MTNTSLKPDILEHTAKLIDLSTNTPARQFVVQHIYPDTVCLLKILHRTIPIHTLIAISYSGNNHCINELEQLGIKVISPEYTDLADVVASELQTCVEYCHQNGDKLVIHEVGGYAISAAHKPTFQHIDTIIAALEITKQGVWEAERIPHLRFPQFNIAQTKIKAIEGNLVGDAVVSAIDNIMKEIGLSLSGRQTAVTGYGWIGKGTAHSLRKRNSLVGIAESNSLLRLEASLEGFSINDLFSKASLIVGCTGRCSIDHNIISQLPDGCVMASGASKNHEIDLNALSPNHAEVSRLHDHITAHPQADGRTLYLLNDGYPVNFTGPSVADEIVELLFAELLVLVPKIFNNSYKPGIYTLSDDEEMVIADNWLQLRGNQPSQTMRI